MNKLLIISRSRDRYSTFRETPLGPGAKKDGCFRRLVWYEIETICEGKFPVVPTKWKLWNILSCEASNLAPTSGNSLVVCRIRHQIKPRILNY